MKATALRRHADWRQLSPRAPLREPAAPTAPSRRAQIGHARCTRAAWSCWPQTSESTRGQQGWMSVGGGVARRGNGPKPVRGGRRRAGPAAAAHPAPWTFRASRGRRAPRSASRAVTSRRVATSPEGARRCWVAAPDRRHEGRSRQSHESIAAVGGGGVRGGGAEASRPSTRCARPIARPKSTRRKAASEPPVPPTAIRTDPAVAATAVARLTCLPLHGSATTAQRRSLPACAATGRTTSAGWYPCGCGAVSRA